MVFSCLFQTLETTITTIHMSSKQTHLLHTQDGEWQVAFWSYDTAQEPTPHSQIQHITEVLLGTAASFTVHIISI